MFLKKNVCDKCALPSWVEASHCNGSRWLSMELSQGTVDDLGLCLPPTLSISFLQCQNGRAIKSRGWWERKQVSYVHRPLHDHSSGLTGPPTAPAPGTMPCRHSTLLHWMCAWALYKPWGRTKDNLYCWGHTKNSLLFLPHWDHSGSTK